MNAGTDGRRRPTLPISTLDLYPLPPPTLNHRLGLPPPPATLFFCCTPLLRNRRFTRSLFQRRHHEASLIHNRVYRKPFGFHYSFPPPSHASDIINSTEALRTTPDISPNFPTSNGVFSSSKSDFSGCARRWQRHADGALVEALHRIISHQLRRPPPEECQGTDATRYVQYLGLCIMFHLADSKQAFKPNPK
jgi:hypothetical protein